MIGRSLGSPNGFWSGFGRRYWDRLEFLYAGGVTAISRWLSAATPPEKGCEKQPTPEGVAATERNQDAATPAGVMTNADMESGGVAALNHRLIAGIPAGILKSSLRHCPKG